MMSAMMRPCEGGGGGGSLCPLSEFQTFPHCTGSYVADRILSKCTDTYMKE